MVSKTHNVWREEFGRRLAGLRESRQLSGRALAKKLKISQSKLSKLETGKLIASREFLEAFADVLTLSRTERNDLFIRAEVLLQEFNRFDVSRRGEFSKTQRAISVLGYQTLRVFQVSLVPGLLQTKEYVDAVFSSAKLSPFLPAGGDVDKDLRQAIKERLRQQENLNKKDKRFAFLIHESALRTRVCSDKEMVAQLRHLKSFVGRENVEVGVIPWRANLPVLGVEFPMHSFDIFDETLVSVELFVGTLDIWDPAAVKEYVYLFSSLRKAAVYGQLMQEELDRIAEDYKRKG